MIFTAKDYETCLMMERAGILTPEEDFYNSKRTRNKYNTDTDDYNCGGYALETYSWYYPYDEEEAEDMVLENKFITNFKNGMTTQENYDYFMSRFVKRILSDFEDRIRLVKKDSVLFGTERLIAFKFFFHPYDEERGFKNLSDVHFDFHFRFFDDNWEKWVEKCGLGELKFCEVDEDWNEIDVDWDCGFNLYDSDTVYFAFKV